MVSFLELVILAWAAGPKQSLYPHLPSLGIQVSRLTRNRASSWTCLTANQRLVAAGTAEDRLVIVWSADSGQVVAAMPGHASPLTSIHFSSVSSLNQSSLCRMFISSVYSVIVVLFSQPSRGGGEGLKQMKEEE
jgi:WD40 repeat protein